MKNWLLLISFLLCVVRSLATTYYVSPDGNDSNNGTSPSTPWKTISKVNGQSFVPGDIILFKRGASWRETLIPRTSGSAGKPITFSAYGSGANPIINGASIYKGQWTNSSPNVWVMNSPVAADVTPTLMIDGVILSRKKTLPSLALNEFFIDKQPKTDRIYIYSTTNPNTQNVEISARSYGIYIDRKSYINISQLTVVNCLNAGLRLDGHGLFDGKPGTYFKGNVIIDHVVAANSVMYGIVTGNGFSYTTIKNCRSYSNGNGFYADGNGDHTLFQSDTAYLNYSQTDPFTDGNGFGVYKSNFNTVEQCLAYNNKTGNGIEVDLNATDSAIVIRYNRAFNNGTSSEGYGIKTGNLAGSAAANMVYYNLSYLNGNDPVDKMGREFYHHYGNISFYNNTAYTTGTAAAYGITLAGTGSVVVRNNIFYTVGGNNMRCIRRLNAAKLEADHNLYYSSGGGSFADDATPYDFKGWQKLGYDNTNSQYVNALFTLAGSVFTLQSASPAINSGVPVGLSRDIVGTSIQDQPDIGAFETAAVIVPPSNIPPIVNAGNDLTITLPVNSVTLKGTASDKDGTVVTYAWKQISGPSTSAIASGSTATATVTKLVLGDYRYTLTATDNKNATAADTITVHVKAAANKAPVAQPGANQTITLPNNGVTLDGSKSKDSDGIVKAYNWEQVSGPGTAQIASASAAKTAVTRLVQGTYIFRLTVTDDGNASHSATVTVTVKKKPNVAPTADAGADKVITLPVNMVSLSASASTDTDGNISSFGWRQISGPSAGVVNAAGAENTTVTSLVVGVYQFQLTVHDNENAVAFDTVKVLVQKAGNKAPVADAGFDQTIQSPKAETMLNGSGSSDPDGKISSYHWKQVKGPAAILSSPDAAITKVQGLKTGSYQFVLTVSDAVKAVDSDTVIVTVTAAVNQLPQADAGADQTILLPRSEVVLNGAGSSDKDGAIKSYRWRQFNGPSPASLSTANAAATKVTGLKAGVYRFILTVTDNQSASASDTIVITVRKPVNQKPVARAGEPISINVLDSLVTLDGSASSDPDGVIVRYSWELVHGAAGVSISHAGSKVTNVKGLQGGAYTFRLTVVDNDGDTDSKLVKVTVVDQFASSEDPFVLYPNPARDIVNLRLFGNSAATIGVSVVAVNGSTVLRSELQKPAAPWSGQLDVAKLLPGVYLVEIMRGGIRQTTKLVKQ